MGVEPNPVLRLDGCGKGVWLGGAMWSAPRAELEVATSTESESGGSEATDWPHGPGTGTQAWKQCLVRDSESASGWERLASAAVMPAALL